MTTDSRFPWPNTEDHVELLLDRALEATFPASDPVALTLARDFLPARHAGRGRLATGQANSGNRGLRSAVDDHSRTETPPVTAVTSG